MYGYEKSRLLRNRISGSRERSICNCEHYTLLLDDKFVHAVRVSAFSNELILQFDKAVEDNAGFFRANGKVVFQLLHGFFSPFCFHYICGSRCPQMCDCEKQKPVKLNCFAGIRGFSL